MSFPDDVKEIVLNREYRMSYNNDRPIYVRCRKEIATNDSLTILSDVISPIEQKSLYLSDLFVQIINPAPNTIINMIMCWVILRDFETALGSLRMDSLPSQILLMDPPIPPIYGWRLMASDNGNSMQHITLFKDILLRKDIVQGLLIQFDTGSNPLPDPPILITVEFGYVLKLNSM